MFQNKKILNLELALITALCIAVYLFWKQMAYGYVAILVAAVVLSSFYIIIGILSAFKDAETKVAKLSWLTFAYGMGAGILGILIKILRLPNADIFFYMSFMAVVVAILVIYKFKDASMSLLLNRLLGISGIHFIMFVLQRFL